MAAGDIKKHASGGILSAGYFIVMHLLFSYKRATMKHSCIELHAREKKTVLPQTQPHTRSKEKTNKPFNLNCSTYNILKNFFPLDRYFVGQQRIIIKC